MARSGAKRKQRPRPTPQGRGGSARSSTRHEFSAAEQAMFFPKLRRQAKWMFVFLVLVFGLGFVVFGVGSGGGLGLQDIFKGAGVSSGMPSASSARKKIAKNPNDAAAWRELATALINDNKQDEAVNALEQYVTLKPKDYASAKELASYYEGRATKLRDDAATLQAGLQSTTAGSTFGVPLSTKLGRAIGTGRIDQEVTALANKKLNDNYAGSQSAYTRAAQLYQRVSAATPDDALLVLHLGDVAYQARLVPLALRSYQRFIKIAPSDPQASYAKRLIAFLKFQVKTQHVKGR
jgi:tetratricopeptide (TPR) repeat protein